MDYCGISHFTKNLPFKSVHERLRATGYVRAMRKSNKITSYQLISFPKIHAYRFGIESSISIIGSSNSK